MKIFIAPGAPLDGSLYLEEILKTFAPPCIERTTLAEALQQADADCGVLVLPRGSEIEGVESFLNRGGNVVAIQPREELLKLAGLQSAGERQTPGRIRVVGPFCAAAGGESLWTLGAQTIYKSDLPVEDSAGSTLAYLFEPGDFYSESPGVYQRAVGAGSLTIFAYDPALCITRLRQGFPERAGVLPPGESVPRSTYLHAPNAPHDTHWKPTADLHALLLCDVVSDLLLRRAPVPGLWHIPHGKKSVVLFSGDEDGAPQQDNQTEMAELESRGDAMSLYVVPDSTSITRELVAEYSRRGHEISVHPDLTPACGKSVEEQIAKAEADVKKFREDFEEPVETLRNHCGMWPGYLDLPELWERLGVGLDASCIASLLNQSPEVGPYVNVNAAISLRFVREDGTLIDVLQQPTHLSDDLWCHPHLDYSLKYSAAQFDYVARRILEDAAERFHTPYCPIFHPWSYNNYSGEHGRTVLRHAHRLDIPVWTLSRWNRFWRAREQWRLAEYSRSGGRMTFTLSGPPCEGLFVTLPATFDGYALSSLSVGERTTEFEIVERFGRSIAQAALPEGVQEVNVIAEYS